MPSQPALTRRAVLAGSAALGAAGLSAQSRPKQIVISSENGAARLRPRHGDSQSRRRYARCRDRRRQHQRTRSGGHLGRLRRPAERRGRRGTRRQRHARTDAALRRGGVHSRHQDAVQGREAGDGADRSHHAGRRRRVAFRQGDGISRRESAHRESAAGVADLEAIAARSEGSQQLGRRPGRSAEVEEDRRDCAACFRRPTTRRWRWAWEMAVHPTTGTINCLALNPKGEMSGVTTTSGLAGRSRDASGIRRSSARVCTWIRMSAARDPRGAARKIFESRARTPSSKA